MSLEIRIKRHEGRRFKPYKDSEGIWTVGYGRNIDAVPFSHDEIDLMFANDLRRARDGAETFFVYSQLNSVRRDVLVEMIFQMGIQGVSRFKRFLAAALQDNWSEAAKEMLDSRWYRQTPGRAKELSEIFEKG
jgi:lysozyme